MLTLMKFMDKKTEKSNYFSIVLARTRLKKLNFSVFSFLFYLNNFNINLLVYNLL